MNAVASPSLLKSSYGILDEHSPGYHHVYNYRKMELTV